MNKIYTIIDIETTGGDPKRDRITEIAVYRYDGQKVVDQFTTLINPEVPIPGIITHITGIDNDMVANAPRFFEVARRIVEITEGAVFVAHNVRFDYSFIQREFRNLGYTFTRKKLCTVQLSRKLMPGLPSYSLGKICTHLDISNEARHRADGDARATLELFRHLIHRDEQETISATLKAEIAGANLPPNLSKDALESIPEETGVYYFLDQAGKVLYVGKSNNVKKRVLSHFNGAHRKVRTMQMISQIHYVEYEITGSELIALLKENEDIKRMQPPYNRAQRRTQFRYAVYATADGQGFLNLSIDKVDRTQGPVALFYTKGHAQSSLERQADNYHLCPRFCDIERLHGRCFYQQLDKCKGACVGQESPGDYNTRVHQAIVALNHGSTHDDNFFIIGEGRNEEECSVVCVENGQYLGYAYVDRSFAEKPDDLRMAITPKSQTPDVQRIIQAYIRKHPGEVLIF